VLRGPPLSTTGAPLPFEKVDHREGKLPIAWSAWMTEKREQAPAVQTA
jgi:hypothetical protein